MLRLALTQLAPAWLDRDAGIDVVVSAINEAAKNDANLIAFAEAFVPGYPFWLSSTGGAKFESAMQKEIFAHYSDQSVTIESGHLDPVCDALRAAKMSAYVGIIERAGDRSGHSLYCSYVFIDAAGEIKSSHRKLQPTYEERLAWAPGDGAGLVTHRVGDFTLGGLNCWENWMPLPRAALHAQGEDVHFAGWPGCVRNTDDITPFLAKEGRSYCVSTSAIFRKSDIRDDVPFASEIREVIGELHSDGGSCVAAPDGTWLLEPQTGDVGLRYCELDPAFIRRERQNFDPAGHYSRPDVTCLHVNRERRSICKFDDES